jgi:hypothetical protein
MSRPHGNKPLLSCCQSAAARSGPQRATRVLCQNSQKLWLGVSFGITACRFTIFLYIYREREREREVFRTFGFVINLGFDLFYPVSFLSCGAQLSALCWGFRFKQDLTAGERNVYSISAVHKSRTMTCTNWWIGPRHYYFWNVILELRS